jgi:acyl carrier protein
MTRSRDDIRAIVERVLTESFRVPAERIRDDASLRHTLGLDSLDVVDFVFFLNDALGTQAEVEEFRGVETVGQVIEAICARLPDPG